MATNLDVPASVTRTSQIIHGALTMGVLTFGAVVLTTGGGRNPPPAGPIPLSWILGAVAASVLMMSYIFPGFVATALRKAIARGKSGGLPPGLPLEGVKDSDRLAFAFQTSRIIGWAMAEGAAFLSLVNYMVTRDVIGLALAGISVVAMLSRFVTRDRLDAWVSDQQRLLEDERGGVL